MFEEVIDVPTVPATQTKADSNDDLTLPSNEDEDEDETLEPGDQTPAVVGEEEAPV